MDVSLTLIRIIFLFLTTLISTFYASTHANNGLFSLETLIGASFGILFAALIFTIDHFFKRFNLKTFNVAVLGIFFGYLLSQSVLLIISGIINFDELPNGIILKSFLCLSLVYIGMIMTARSANELYVSLPFFKLKSQILKKKDILVDESVLLDPRFIDLASSGLIDNHIIIPRNILNYQPSKVDNDDENLSHSSKKIVDAIQKLESIESLEIRYNDADFSELKNSFEKLIKLAKILDASILTAESDLIYHNVNENIKIIKFNQLCNSLKPLSQCGENINIKIQRVGKEPRQGIGYLEDGTMVVVNGGAKFIEQTIKAQVLSVKRTTSGRIMIFCNALDDSMEPEHIDSSFSLSASSYAISNEEDFLETIPNKYFTL